MNLCIISGSSRAESSSTNVSNYLKQQLIEIDSAIECELFNLAEIDLPMWDENTKVSDFVEYKEILDSADGFVFVVPEWHGMVPPAVKNLFFLFSGVFRHKPAYLVTVSSGTGGRYPIAEMRMSSYKNSYINYIPVNTIIDRVNSVISNNAEYIAEKEFVKKRLDEGLHLLIEYSNAFKQIRNSDVVKEVRFQNGV